MSPKTKQLANQFAEGQRLPVWLGIKAETTLPEQIYRAIDVHGYLRTHFGVRSASLAYQFEVMCRFAAELEGDT